MHQQENAKFPGPFDKLPYLISSSRPLKIQRVFWKKKKFSIQDQIFWYFVINGGGGGH